MTRRLLLVVATAVVVLGAGPGDASSLFLGIGPPSVASRANGVSADGSVVVGRISVADDDIAFRWSLADDITPLVQGSANGASADGSRVAGFAMTPADLRSRAFLWTAGDGFTDVSVSDFAFNTATDVSNDGTTVVGVRGPEFMPGNAAFRWTEGDGAHFIFCGGLLNGSHRANAVSGDGSVIVGSCAGEVIPGVAYRWTAATGAVAFGDLLGGVRFPDSSALGVSADGSTMVGRAVSAFGDEAFRWTAASGMQGIGDLPGGAFESTAVDASADGSVVIGFGTSEAGQEAFLWDAAAGMRNLRTLLADELGLDLDGWTLTEATGISDDGLTLVGYGVNPDGVEQAWIAMIPEPATGLPLAAGLAALASRRR